MDDTKRTFRVAVSLDDIIEAAEGGGIGTGSGIDGFNDFIETRLTESGDIQESGILEDIAYTPVGIEGTNIVIEVSCYVVGEDEDPDDDMEE